MCMTAKRNIIIVLVIAAILPFFTINSCRHEPFGVDLLDTICFNTQVLPILQTSCGISGCHDATTAEGDFIALDYESILKIVKPYKASSSELYRVITDINGPNFMPPNRPLTREQRTTIMIWIQQGAPNTICLPDDGEDPLNYDTICFNQNILPILLSSCGKVGCHDAASHQDGYVLTSFSTLMQNSESIIPFNLNESKVYEVITETNPDDIMPPPPNAPLTSNQQELFRKWILQGALNSDCPWTACDTSSSIGFSQQVWPIIQNNCLGCHSASNPSGGVNLSNYSQVKHFSETLVNGTPILVGALRQNPGFSAMPPTGILGTCQLRTIELWIEQGMQNN